MLVQRVRNDDDDGVGCSSRREDGGVLIPGEGVVSAAALSGVFHMRLRRDGIRRRRNGGSRGRGVEARSTLLRAPVEPPQASPPAAGDGRSRRRRHLRARQMRLPPEADCVSLLLRCKYEAWPESCAGRYGR